MPNIDDLIDTIQQNINSQATDEKTFSTTFDSEYTYSQLN